MKFIILYILILLFGYKIVNNYFANNDLKHFIKNLNNNNIKEHFIIIHLIGGILLMLLYPIQIFIKKYKNLHMILGIILALISLTASISGIIYVSSYRNISGIIYVLSYRSIGGFIMSLSFIIYGILVFAFSILTPLSALIYKSINKSLYFRVRIKKAHKLFGYIYGSLIYSPLFYEIYYTMAYELGYSLPYIEQSYDEPLDIFFNISFYIIPMVFAILYFNFKSLRGIIKCTLALSVAFLLLSLYYKYYFDPKFVLHT